MEAEPQIEFQEHKPAGGGTFSRVFKFAGVRGITIVISVLVGLFLAVFFVNQGGFIDEIYKDSIEWNLFAINRDLPLEWDRDQRVAYLDEQREIMYHAVGLDRPFLERCVEWWKKAVLFDWGVVYQVFTPRDVRDIVGESLANSMMLFGAGTLLTFILTILSALVVSRHFGSWLDKLVIVLAPISTAPNWMYGIILVAIFAIQLQVLPAKGLHDTVFGEIIGDPFLSTLKHMVLPVLAIFLSMFIQGVYSWRTFFIKSANADHLDLAKAMGLPQGKIERKHILRPTLPYIITNLTMMLLAFWQGIIALEVFFDWPGVGQLFLRSFARVQNDVAVAVIVIFAYMMAFTVFLLDFIYALVDPRVRINSASPSVSARKKKRKLFSRSSMALDKSSGAVGQTGRSKKPPQTQKKDKERVLPRARARMAELKRYPTALIGVGMIALLFLASLYTIIAVPQEQAVVMWRGERFDTYQVPELAEPVWFNWFRKDKVPETIIYNSENGDGIRTEETLSETSSKVTLEFPIDYPYAGFPQDIKIKFNLEFEKKQPFLVLTWITPDGRELVLDQFGSPSGKLYSIFYQQRGILANNRMIYGNNPMHYLFQAPDEEELTALPGEYILRIEATFFEPGNQANYEVVMLGQVYGMGGTDIAARDLGIGMLWGLQLALLFGISGALLSTLATMLIAAVGSWFGGWLDRAIQMLTEINMILPVIAIAITIGHAYEATIWTIMGIVVLLSIFGNSIKTYRSVFLQIKESPYIEAAQAYGTSNWRMIYKYLIPEILPLLIPQLVISVPTFVYIEATLAFLGVTGLYLPSLGKIIAQAFGSPYLEGKLFWILEPTVLLLLIGIGFSMLGIALDRVLNPTLKER